MSQLPLEPIDELIDSENNFATLSLLLAALLLVVVFNSGLGGENNFI
jgi:hypothetical protein